MNKTTFNNIQRVITDYRLDLHSNSKYQFPCKVPSVSYWTLDSVLNCRTLYNSSKFTRDIILEDLFDFVNQTVINGKQLPPVFGGYVNVYAKYVYKCKQAYKERIAIYPPNINEKIQDNYVNIGGVHPIIQWVCFKDDPEIKTDETFDSFISLLYKRVYDKNIFYCKEFHHTECGTITIKMFEVMPKTNQYAISIGIVNEITNKHITLFLIPPTLYNIQNKDI